jgi:hypothetical protein
MEQMMEHLAEATGNESRPKTPERRNAGQAIMKG